MSPSRVPPVLIVTGPPGVGKSTTAETLAARLPRAVHLESDAFFRFIRSGYVEPWRPESHDQNRVVMRIVGEVAASYAGAGYFTVRRNRHPRLVLGGKGPGEVADTLFRLLADGSLAI